MHPDWVVVQVPVPVPVSNSNTYAPDWRGSHETVSVRPSLRARVMVRPDVVATWDIAVAVVAWAWARTDVVLDATAAAHMVAMHSATSAVDMVIEVRACHANRAHRTSVTSVWNWAIPGSLPNYYRWKSIAVAVQIWSAAAMDPMAMGVDNEWAIEGHDSILEGAGSVGQTSLLYFLYLKSNIPLLKHFPH